VTFVNRQELEAPALAARAAGRAAAAAGRCRRDEAAFIIQWRWQHLAAISRNDDER
jgi:hypothetical protein